MFKFEASVLVFIKFIKNLMFIEYHMMYVTYILIVFMVKDNMYTVKTVVGRVNLVINGFTNKR